MTLSQQSPQQAADAGSTRPLRIVSLNLCACPNHSRIDDLAELIAAQEPDVALLQECRRGWFDVVCQVAGLTGVHSHGIDPRLPRHPPDGCAVAVRPPLEIGRSWRVAPEAFQPEVIRAEIVEETPEGYEILPDGLGRRYSARTALAELRLGDRSFVAGSFHATPGTGRFSRQRVHEWKPFFHGAIALELARLELPFVFSIDANEPLSETADSVTFHWSQGRPGALKFEALLGLKPHHRARDLLRESYAQTGKPAMADEYLVLTYTTRGGGRRRFDSMWATSEFALEDMATYYEEALGAGTDHALLVADLRF